ncbi:uncharacterized protein LOC114286192 [Camellia sinensis]|uniref:uncharacterized protein LOC114286192 n=1 Tax=Camellia sinensis TaxID=4442 RepID=UPI00103561DE|nr:uncharacterized protein LOC114286192 [Camellia sinensis]
MKESDGNKAPGPDGFNMACFQKCWKVFKKEILQFFNEFYDNGRLAKGINSSFTTLIPKKDCPEGISDYRPISLIGSIYKILSKVLASRLKKVPPRIIRDSQTAFIGGRNILDGVLISNEIVDWSKKKKQKGMILKLDFEKAFDSVNWECLFEMLSSFGFQNKWIRWIKECLQSSRVSILVNGSPTAEFCPENGLRQGDPLSPFLFIIVAESLNMLFQRAKDLGLIKGVVIGTRRINVTHLQFADDTIVFCEAEEQEILNVKRCFEVLSGLRINFHKSKVCGVGVQNEVVADFAKRLNCQGQKLPFTYLGLPLGASPKKKTTWLPVINKFKSKLASWKRKTLSFGGRLTMIKSVLTSLPMYYLSLFKVLMGVVKLLDRIQARRLRDVNECLLAKWWWRYGGEDQALWKDVVASKYSSFGGRWRPFLVEGIQCSRIWGDILNLEHISPNLFNFFMENSVIKVGNGRRISFWEDHWASNCSLRVEFPRLFELSDDKEANLNQMIDRRNNSVDSLVWKASSSGMFTVKSVYNRNYAAQGSEDVRWIWQNLSPPRVQFFGWLVWKGRIKSSTFLQRIGCLSQDATTECVFCDCAVETDCHVLLQCMFAWKIWSNIMSWWGMQWVIPENARGVLEWWRGFKWSIFETKIWNVIPFAVFWSIWTLRNDCIFNGKQHCFMDICELIKTRIALWIRSNTSLSQYSVHDVVENLPQI